MHARAGDASDVVRATINYVAPMNKRAKFHAQDAGRDNLRFNPQEVDIVNARSLALAPSLEREGFCLARHKTAVRDFHDRDEVREVYLPELVEFVQTLLNPVRVSMLGQGGNVRYAERADRYGTGVNTRPARFPHVDFTDRTGPGMVPEVFGAKLESLALGEQVMGFNVWRPLNGPPQDVPLALCDSRTVQRFDLIPADGVYDVGEPDSWMELEAWVLAHNPAHRWFYYRDMQPDEVLVFRSYDSLPTWRSGVPHSAFDDPLCPADAPGRMSFEARAVTVVKHS